MPFSTAEDLASDALWLAGEPTDGTSDFASRVADYLTAVQDTVLGGGPLGGAVLPLVDWLAFRKRSGFEVREPFTTEAGSIVSGDAVLAGATIPWDAVGAVFSTPEIDRTFRVVAHSGIILTLDHEATTAPEAVTGFTLTPREFSVPADFVRFVGPLRERDGTRVLSESATPVALDGGTYRRVTDRTIELSTSAPGRFDFEYIARPESLAQTVALLPAPHRRLLSLGAAYLVLLDKADEKAATLYQQFAVEWDALERDQTRSYRTSSTVWGRPVERTSAAPFRGWR